MPWLRTQAKPKLADVRISKNITAQRVTMIINGSPCLAFGISTNNQVFKQSFQLEFFGTSSQEERIINVVNLSPNVCCTTRGICNVCKMRRMDFGAYGLRVFEKKVLRGIFGPEEDQVAGGWRKLHNEKLHSLYCSPSIIRAIKSRRMRWVGHTARRGIHIGYWWVSQKERDH
jgi:hypothetical protein